MVRGVSLRLERRTRQPHVFIMPLPPPVLDPPFNITRVSHVILTSRDLDASRRFYSDVLGLVVSDSDKEALYLRGLEEAGHHSLVIRKSDDAPVCQAIGFRVLTEADLDKARDWLDRSGVSSAWVTVPHQGRTLRFTDGSGAPVELCATMDIVPRLMQSFDRFHGGSPQHLFLFDV
jgi:catechol 2,3-dioxygenase